MFQAFVEAWARDLRKALDGIESLIDGKQFLVAVLHIKGDWPFLVKIGELNRSFHNAPKRASSNKNCTGICHLCEAGRPGVPFEDLRADGEWQFTVGTVTPWIRNPVVLQSPHDSAFPESLRRIHFRRGILEKDGIFAANCVKFIMPLANRTNNDVRLDLLFRNYSRGGFFS